MDIRELNLETMAKISATLQGKEGTFSQFDSVVYELIEAGLFEADSGNFVQAVWDGKEIAECDACAEFKTDLILDEGSGLAMCTECQEEEV